MLCCETGLGAAKLADVEGMTCTAVAVYLHVKCDVYEVHRYCVR